MITKTRNDSANNNIDHEVKDGNVQNKFYNHRIEHATTTTVVNNRFTTKCTLDILPEKQNLVINSSKVHRNIFEATKQMNNTAPTITQDNIRITNSITFPADKERKISCKITKRIHISFTLESEFNLSQIKYGSRYNSTNGIIETLRENLACLKMEKYNSLKEASIGLFLRINPKLRLRKVLKQKIDDICIWIDLDEEDTKNLIKEITTNNKTSQELIIQAFDIRNKEFGTGTGNERIASNVYELRTILDNATIPKSILLKASHPDNNPTIQFISYGIQGITNKDIYKIVITIQNAFISDISIIPIYDIEERDINKFQKLIDTSLYIQDRTNT